MTIEDLIKLCEDAVVPCSKWDNRDSYSAQKKIQSIYEGLTAINQVINFCNKIQFISILLQFL
jgi:hypothetical protein